MLLTPGFVDAHTHNHMTALRNRADDVPFTDWLFKTVMPMEDTLTAQGLLVRAARNHGATFERAACFLDMHMFPGTFGRATVDAGMRAVLSRGLARRRGRRGGRRAPHPRNAAGHRALQGVRSC